MMRTLIRNVTAIMLDEDDRILQEIDIGIDGDSILAVGRVPERFEADEVIDGPQSVVVQQAANRMHVQKGILAWLLGAQS